MDKKSILFDWDIFILLILSAILMTMSVILYKERIIFTDTAVYMNSIVQNESFYIATNRYISTFTQLLPVAGIWAGLPLKSLLVLYSVNYMLVPVLLSFLCVILFKDKRAALALLLFYIVSNVWLFYYPVSEFQTGLAFLIFYHSFLLYYFKKSRHFRPYFLVVGVLMVSTIIFSHPISLLVFAAWWVLFLLCHRKILNLQFIAPVIIALIVWYVKENFFKSMVGTYDYEAHRREGLAYFSEPIVTYFKNDLSRMMSKAWKDHYFLTIAMVAWMQGWLAYRKKWLIILYFASVLLCFWILITVNFKYWPFDQYMEHMYQPLTFFIVLPLAYYLPEMYRYSIGRNMMLLVFTGILFIKIINNRNRYQERHAWYMDRIEKVRQQGIHKAVLSLDENDFLSYDDCWASSSETLLLSSLSKQQQPVVLLFRRNDMNIENVNQNNKKYNEYYFPIGEKEHFQDLRN